ncbi:putative muscle system process [Operophtera brumata]|uniref:Putative muscle system process n=1 Tax=Operophtera brumata TaxID=104452 RepID=A0A0L7KSE5_OPEBR|nr:putative muscle system process [Operophtera brumata]
MITYCPMSPAHGTWSSAGVGGRKPTWSAVVKAMRLQGLQEFEKLAKALEGVELSAEEKQSLEELQQYLHGEGSWMCNLFENISSSEWLLYISEWEYKGQPLSNIRATTKVCVHSLLSEDAELRDAGTALLHNIAAKEEI